MRSFYLKLTLTVSIFFFLNAASVAQNNKVNKNPKPNKSIPIDGGITLLIAAGLGVGAGKFILGKKPHNNE